MVYPRLNDLSAKIALQDRSALHVAFGGCGTTLQNACKRMGVDFNNVPAVLDLLGELLMVAGAGCLPGPTVEIEQGLADDALIWPSLKPKEQLSKLQTLISMLTTPPSWRSHSDIPTVQKPMLPLEMGPWNGHHEMPSCFGMLVILASYGYLTNAPMLAASVQRLAAEPVAIGLTSLFRTAYQMGADLLNLTFRKSDLFAWLLEKSIDAEDSARSMLDRNEFHGAMLIRLKKGLWVSVDPYMMNLSILDPAVEPLDEIAGYLQFNPSAVATVKGQVHWPAQDRLLHKLRMVRGILELARNNTLLYDGMHPLQLCEVLEALLVEHCGFAIPSPGDLLRFAVKTAKQEQAPNSTTALAIVAATPASGVYDLRERILLSALRVWTADTWKKAQKSRYEDPHQALVVSDPARSLAVWVIINLRHRLARKKTVRALDLLPCLGGDVVLYNAVIDSKNRYVSAFEQQWLDLRKEHFQRVSSYLQHPLIVEVLAS